MNQLKKKGVSTGYLCIKNPNFLYVCGRCTASGHVALFNLILSAEGIILRTDIISVSGPLCFLLYAC